MSYRAGFGNPFALEREKSARAEVWRADQAAESHAARDGCESSKRQQVPMSRTGPPL